MANLLPSVQTHTIGRFGDHFVYWSDIQGAVLDVSNLLDDRGERVFFDVVQKDDNYEMYALE